MALDTPGAMIISCACMLLFRGVILAFVRHRAVDEARTQHYTDAAHEKRSWSAGAQSVLDAMPPRLRIGLGMGLAGALVPFAMRKLSQWALGGDGEGGDSTLGKAFFIAGKWLVLGAILQTVRRWGVQRIVGTNRQPAAATNGKNKMPQKAQ